jgi:hypothetical protein
LSLKKINILLLIYYKRKHFVAKEREIMSFDDLVLAEEYFPAS